MYPAASVGSLRCQQKWRRPSHPPRPNSPLFSRPPPASPLVARREWTCRTDQVVPDIALAATASIRPAMIECPTYRCRRSALIETASGHRRV